MSASNWVVHVVCSANDVLEMSVVRGMRGVGVVYELYMCLARGGALVCGGECERIRFGFYQYCRNGGSVGRVGCGGVRSSGRVIWTRV